MKNAKQFKDTGTNRRAVFTADARFKLNRAKFDAKGVEAAEGEEKITLTGYPILWNVLSGDRGYYKVRLLPGSAQFATPSHALFHHDFRMLIGSTNNNTLRIMPDDVGVKVEIDLPDTSAGRDTAELVEDKYVGGMSFSMLWDDVLEYDIIDADSENEIMEVKKFTCDEVTVTAIPSFIQTTVGIQEAEPAPAVAEPVLMARVAASHRFNKLRLASLRI